MIAKGDYIGRTRVYPGHLGPRGDYIGRMRVSGGTPWTSPLCPGGQLGQGTILDRGPSVLLHRHCMHANGRHVWPPGMAG